MMKKLSTIMCFFVCLLFWAGCMRGLHTPRGTFQEEGYPAWPWGALYLVVPKYNRAELVRLSKRPVLDTKMSTNKGHSRVYRFSDIRKIHYLLYATQFNLNKKGEWVDEEVGQAIESFFERSDEQIVCDALVFGSAFPDLRKGVYAISSHLSNPELEKRLFEVVKRYGDRQMIDDALKYGPRQTKGLVANWLKEHGKRIANPYYVISAHTYYRPVFVLFDDAEFSDLEYKIKNRTSVINPELVDRLLIVGSYYARKNTEEDQVLARRIYNILKQVAPDTLLDGIKRTYLFAINDLPLIAFYVRLGVSGTERYLIDILNSYKYGYRRMNMLRRRWSMIVTPNGLLPFYDPPPIYLFRPTKAGQFEDYLMVFVNRHLSGAGMSPIPLRQSQIHNYYLFLEQKELNKKYPPRLRLHSLETAILLSRCGNYTLEQAGWNSLFEMSKWIRTDKLKGSKSFPIVQWGSFDVLGDKHRR